MPNKTKCSESRKNEYKSYLTEKRAELNAELKLERHLKKHPNDIQSKERKVPDYTQKRQ